MHNTKLNIKTLHKNQNFDLHSNPAISYSRLSWTETLSRDLKSTVILNLSRTGDRDTRSCTGGCLLLSEPRFDANKPAVFVSRQKGSRWCRPRLRRHLASHVAPKLKLRRPFTKVESPNVLTTLYRVEQHNFNSRSYMRINLSRAFWIK